VLNLRPPLIAFVAPSLPLFTTLEGITLNIDRQKHLNLSHKRWSIENSEPLIPGLLLLSKDYLRGHNEHIISHHQDDWALYYNLKRECQRECHRAYTNYVTSLVDDNNNVSK